MRKTCLILCSAALLISLLAIPNNLWYLLGSPPITVSIADPKTSEDKMDLMVTDLASKLHDMWREPRRIKERQPGQLEFKPRIKNVNGVDFDIANLSYTKLPEKFQIENREAARGALQEINSLVRQVGVEKLRDTATIELLADTIHKQWMARNGSWAPQGQMVPYEDLPESEKEKDRVVARAAIETFLQETR